MSERDATWRDRIREPLKALLKRLGLWELWVGLQVMLERLREEVSPFPPEPWRRG